MAATPISMPRLGMSMEEGRVIEWRVAIGDRIEKGEILLVIESEKSEVEIEAVASGHLRHIYVELDETVPCGSLLAVLTEQLDEPFDAEALAAELAPRESETSAQNAAIPIPEPPASKESGHARPEAARPAREQAHAHRPAAPAARARARKLGVPIDAVPGTGPGGRVTREDVEAWAESGGARVEVGEGIYVEAPSEGEGDPVLLLPGFGTDISVFARQVPRLIEHYRVIGMNPRGVGLSSAPETDEYAIAQGAADAAQLADGPMHVVGASMGAAMAIELALTNPDRVRSLTLITPFVRVPARLLAVIDAWIDLAATTPPQTLARAMLPWFFSETFLEDKKTRARTVRGLAQTFARVQAPALARWAAGLRAWSGRRAGDLERIQAPTLVIAGGRDLLAPDGEALSRQIPAARFLSIPEAGHAVSLEAADSVSAALESHLGSAT